MKKGGNPEVINPSTKRRITVSGMRADTGVYIDTDGKSNFSSPQEVMTWRRAVEVMGLFRAVLYFFNREDLPQVK